jgi:hypothetical protein
MADMSRATAEQLDLLSPPITFIPGSDPGPPGGALPDELVRELELLMSAPPLWPVDGARWAAVVASATAFARRWDGQARGHGWSPLVVVRLASARAVRPPGHDGRGIFGGLQCRRCSRLVAVPCAVRRGRRQGGVTVTKRDLPENV